MCIIYLIPLCYKNFINLYKFPGIILTFSMHNPKIFWHGIFHFFFEVCTLSYIEKKRPHYFENIKKLETPRKNKFRFHF